MSREELEKAVIEYFVKNKNNEIKDIVKEFSAFDLKAHQAHKIVDKYIRERVRKLLLERAENTSL